MTPSVRTAERPKWHWIPREKLDHCVLLQVCVDRINGVPIRRYASDSALDAEFTILRGGQPESMRCCTPERPRTLSKDPPGTGRRRAFHPTAGGDVRRTPDPWR